MLTVITGPPCSGKSTHARTHALPGDIIIDFDLIAQALGSPVAWDHDPQFVNATLEARDAAIAASVHLHHTGARVWVVDSRPPPSRRRWFQREGARWVHLDAPREELHRRADADGRPHTCHERIDQFIDERR